MLGADASGALRPEAETPRDVLLPPHQSQTKDDLAVQPRHEEEEFIPKIRQEAVEEESYGRWSRGEDNLQGVPNGKIHVGELSFWLCLW